MSVQIRKYENTDLDAVLSSWEVATRLAHPFMT
ncbi:MAG TPA: GNAT family N-acetyltransferase, partial [Haliea salexigens]|nr:GNAT family N-acetyltransferase [Haliea salexigens]